MVLRRTPSRGRAKRCSATISLSCQLSRPPALIEGSDRKARDRIEHFLRAAIDNDNTRRAYGRSLGSFVAFLEDGGKERVQDIGPLDVRDYLEAAKTNGLSPPSSSTRPPSACSSTTSSPAACSTAKAPRQKLGKGKTPVLTAEEAGELLRSIESSTVTGLRDRALIGVMVFTFARVSAACGMNVADILHQKRRLWVRLHEKGGKLHEMTCHHTLEGYLAEYLETARSLGLGEEAVRSHLKKRKQSSGPEIAHTPSQKPCATS
jgi:site-specific recombinase XerD